MCIKGLPVPVRPQALQPPARPRSSVTNTGTRDTLPEDLPSGRSRPWALWLEVSSGPTRSCVSAGPASASWGCAATRSSRGSRAPMPPTQFTTSCGQGASVRAAPRHACPLHPSRPSSLESWVSSRPPRAQSHSPAHPAHKCPCSRFLHTLSTWAQTFTSQVSTLWPVRRPSSPWPGDRSRHMLFLQAWEQGLARVSGGWGQAGDREREPGGD